MTRNYVLSKQRGIILPETAHVVVAGQVQSGPRPNRECALSLLTAREVDYPPGVFSRVARCRVSTTKSRPSAAIEPLGRL